MKKLFITFTEPQFALLEEQMAAKLITSRSAYLASLLVAERDRAN